jgi:hypothetical protein
LADNGIRICRCNCIASIDGKRSPSIVHDGTVVVCPDIIAVSDMLVEVVLTAGHNFIPIDGDKAIPILPAMLVP